MSNCSNCGFNIPPDKVCIREIYKEPINLLNFIKRILFKKKKDFKKQLVCRICARKIDLTDMKIEIYLALVLLIFAMVTTFTILF